MAAAQRGGATLRRNFLPGLGQILAKGDGSMRRTQKWQRIVPHRTETIWRAVAEVDQYSTFLPWCLQSRVLNRAIDDATGEGDLSTEITVGWKNLGSTFRSRVRLTPMTSVHAESEANEYIDHLSFTWDFRAVGEKTCRLDLGLDFALRNPEHLLMWEIANEKIISEYVRCFTRRCAALESDGAARAL